MDERTAAERGSPEFAEDRTQVNSLNNKWLFDEGASGQFTAAKRSQAVFDQLQARQVAGLDELLSLQQKVNQQYLHGREQTLNFRERWEYNTAYDLANPVSTAAGDSLRANAAPANRATDSIQNATSGGVAVSAEAVAAAVAKQVDASLTPLMAVLASIANVLAQVQPKTAA